MATDRRARIGRREARVSVRPARRRLPWPFLFVVDGEGRSNGWSVLSGPLRTSKDLATYHQLRQSFRFIGFTSYLTFPAINEGVVTDYGTLVEAWCHCFRVPERYLPDGVAKVLVSESDFVDCGIVTPVGAPAGAEIVKRFDFVYVCLPGRWKEMTKNWALAKVCLWHLCQELDLKGLLVGRSQILDLPFRRNLTVTGDLPSELLWQCITSARFLFVPSIMDASPRILSEALCLDVPVLVHNDILGGWKYVNSSTGAFFAGSQDVGQAALHCLHAELGPREWYGEHFGPTRASSRLSALLHQLDPRVEVTRSLRLARECLVPAP